MRGHRRLSGLPLRARLTIVFCGVIAVVLAVTGLVVYLQFRQGVDSRIDEELADRQAVMRALAAEGPAPGELVSRTAEPLVQVFGPGGRLLATTARLGSSPLLDPEQVLAARASSGLSATASLDGTDDGARVRAFPLPGRRVGVVGEPLDDRARSLRRLAIILAVTLPVALLAASVAGYRVAGAALTPVERMRRRAQDIGAGELHERLPEPGTGDELDRLAVTLNELLSRIEQAVERERRVIDDASHELRTPVSILLTRLEVARRQHLDRQALEAVLDEAAGDARRLSRLADDLLLLARADQGRLPLRPEPLDVMDLLETAARRGRDAAADDGREIVARLGIPGGAVVLADPDRTAQVLDNLIGNSLRHGAGAVDVRADREGEHVWITVSDRGPGYPAAMRPEAFERFPRGGRGTEGAGLGLAICDAIVRAQGGEIRAANDEGGGAVTRFSLPLA
jgi:two-component system OmpR family sensor kinase